MIVRVDPLLCACTGYCVRTVPEVFQLPEGAQSSVVVEASPPEGLRDRVLEARDLCPTNAISVGPE